MDCIEKLIAKIADKEGFKNYKFKTERGTKKGDGFLGDILMVRIEDASSRVIHLVLKSGLTDERVLDRYQIGDVYAQELQFYSVIFPTLDKFQIDNDINHWFKAVAKYYDNIFEGNNKIIALENLRHKGFDLFNKKALMDGKHVSLVFTQYGRLHALSFAFRKKHPEKFQEMTKSLENFWSKFSNKDRFLNYFKDVFEYLIPRMKKNGEKALVDKLTEYRDTSGSIFRDVAIYKGKYSAILHGDCWSNNMMFKYAVNNKNGKEPQEMCFLDWQLTSVGTPVFDLSYFLYSSASKEVYTDLKTYLQIYYNSLSTTLEEFGEKSEDLYPFNAFLSDWQEYSKFGLFLGFLLQRMKVTNDEEIKDLHDLADKNESEKQGFFANGAYNQEAYDSRMQNLVLHAFETGIL